MQESIMQESTMQMYISGSLAIDRIMTFPGKFQDHILPDKLHMLNVCFLVDGLEERWGGTAGNIAYTLALLGEKARILSSAGKDFAAYRKRLESYGILLDGVREVADDFTASAYITTDLGDNQITGFNPAAMNTPCAYTFPNLGHEPAIAIVAPGNLEDMMQLPELYRSKGIPYLFDPGQNTTAFSGEQLLSAIDGASMLVSNDYELELILKSTGLTPASLLERTERVLTTLGEQGCKMLDREGEYKIPAVQVAQAVDPTGAGDAFRAGLLKGLAQGLELNICCCLGVTAASFCVECQGTQAHTFSAENFRTRYEANFGTCP